MMSFRRRAVLIFARHAFQRAGAPFHADFDARERERRFALSPCASALIFASTQARLGAGRLLREARRQQVADADAVSRRRSLAARAHRRIHIPSPLSSPLPPRSQAAPRQARRHAHAQRIISAPP